MNALIQWVIRTLAGVTAEQWGRVLDYVLSAASNLKVGEDKKAWVLDKMKNLGISGSIANFLVESAVTFLKRKGAIASS